MHGICPPPTSPAPSTSDSPIASSPLHPAQHQLQQQKKQAIETMKEHLMKQTEKNCCNKKKSIATSKEHIINETKQ
jgi:hypothetical protein